MHGAYSVKLHDGVEGLFSGGREVGLILKMACFLENCIGTDDWKCRYIRGMLLFMSY